MVLVPLYFSGSFSHFFCVVIADCLHNTRYNPVLESVITCTDELAYKQAKEADGLLAKGVYLGTYFIYSLLL